MTDQTGEKRHDVNAAQDPATPTPASVFGPPPDLETREEDGPTLHRLVSWIRTRGGERTSNGSMLMGGPDGAVIRNGRSIEVVRREGAIPATRAGVTAALKSAELFAGRRAGKTAGLLAAALGAGDMALVARIIDADEQADAARSLAMARDESIAAGDGDGNGKDHHRVPAQQRRWPGVDRRRRKR